MSGDLIGYARVSTGKQDVTRQRDALTAAGCARIFIDEASGKNTDRPELGNCLDYVRAGDTLVVPELDRFARSLIDLVTMVDDLREREIGFRVLTGHLANIDTNTPDGRLMMQIIGAMAEFERALIRQRTVSGLEAARAQGRVGGRPTVVTADILAAAEARRARGETMKEITEALGVSRAALYRALGREA